MHFGLNYELIYQLDARNYNIYCSWRWACKPEICRAESTQINTQLHQVGKLIHNTYYILCISWIKSVYLLLMDGTNMKISALVRFFVCELCSNPAVMNKCMFKSLIGFWPYRLIYVVGGVCYNTFKADIWDECNSVLGKQCAGILCRFLNFLSKPVKYNLTDLNSQPSVVF